MSRRRCPVKLMLPSGADSDDEEAKHMTYEKTRDEEHDKEEKKPRAKQVSSRSSYTCRTPREIRGGDEPVSRT